MTLLISDEVSAALTDGRPVVALETTLVSHGFSAGRGLQAAVESERRVREAGAVPATVGVLDGIRIREIAIRNNLGRYLSSSCRPLASVIRSKNAARVT